MSYPNDPMRRPDGTEPTRPLPAQPSEPAHEPAYKPRMVIDAPRLWSGGVATAIVAALLAWVGLLIIDGVLDLSPSKVAVVFSPFQSFTGNYVLTAALAAIAATGLAHLLYLSTPRPLTFFKWIVGLATVAATVVPFTRDGTMADKVAVGVLNLVLGICIGSLVSAVMARTVVDRSQEVRAQRRIR